MKTLFQKWCEDNERPALPAQYQQENPFLAVLKLAEVQTATFEQRQSRRVRTWFANHPECRQTLLPIDWREQQLRGETLIDTESRAGSGWFDKATGVKVFSEEFAYNPYPIETFDNALEMATALNSPAYKREIMEEYPLVKAGDGSMVNAAKRKGRKPRTKTSDKQMELELII